MKDNRENLNLLNKETSMPVMSGCVNFSQINDGTMKMEGTSIVNMAKSVQEDKSPVNKNILISSKSEEILKLDRISRRNKKKAFSFIINPKRLEMAGHNKIEEIIQVQNENRNVDSSGDESLDIVDSKYKNQKEEVKSSNLEVHKIEQIPQKKTFSTKEVIMDGDQEVQINLSSI